MAQPTKSKPKRAKAPKAAPLGAGAPPDMMPPMPTDIGPPSAGAPLGMPQAGPVGPTPGGPPAFKPSDLVKKGQSKKKGG